MKSPVCDMLGVEFPLFAFSHCTPHGEEARRCRLEP